MQCKKKEFIIEEKGYYIQHGYDTEKTETVQENRRINPRYYIYYIYQKFIKRQIVYKDRSTEF